MNKIVLDSEELVGFEVIDNSTVEGDFEGSDFDEIVSLDNGMKFSFNDYNYNYSYRPDVVILAKKTMFKGYELLSWKLIIEEEIYDVDRVE